MYNTNGQWGRIAIDLYSSLPYMVLAVVLIALLAFAYTPSREFIINSIEGVVKSSYSSNSIGDKTKTVLSSGDW